MAFTTTVTDLIIRTHSVLNEYQFLISATYIQTFILQNIRGGSGVLRVLFAAFVFGFPFLLPHIYGYIAIPKGYEGVRNEDLDGLEGYGFQAEEAPASRLNGSFRIGRQPAIIWVDIANAANAQDVRADHLS